MKDSQNIQPANSTIAGGVQSADDPTTQTDDTREFLRVFMLASPRSRSQICHLLQAYEAGRRRSVFEWLYHWAAFVAVNPRAAYRVTPALRRVVHGVAIGLCLAFALTLLTACSGDSGGANSLRATAQAAGVVQIEAQPATPTPTDQPAQISATETPDLQPMSTVLPTTQPAQVVDATQTPQAAQISDAGIDESAQPCPVKYWRNGRCTATQAQIEAAASEVQP